MGSVKTPKGAESVADRIRLIRRRLNPHGDSELPWPDFAAFVGAPLGTVKKWESRDGISHDSAVMLAARLATAGLTCTAEWIRLGTKPVPEWAGATPSYAGGKRTPTLIREPAIVAGSADGGGDRETVNRGYKGDRAFVPASVLAVLERMPEDMQRAAIAAAFARGLDHQELNGGGLLRAAMGVCRELRRLGFTGVAKEIESEMMQAVFAEIEQRSPPPEPPKLTSG
jgi:hypothetical protein